MDNYAVNNNIIIICKNYDLIKYAFLLAVDITMFCASDGCHSEVNTNHVERINNFRVSFTILNIHMTYEYLT